MMVAMAVVTLQPLGPFGVGWFSSSKRSVATCRRDGLGLSRNCMGNGDARDLDGGNLFLGGESVIFSFRGERQGESTCRGERPCRGTLCGSLSPSDGKNLTAPKDPSRTTSVAKCGDTRVGWRLGVDTFNNSFSRFKRSVSLVSFLWSSLDLEELPPAPQIMRAGLHDLEPNERAPQAKVNS
jgi:hypothetical protein